MFESDTESCFELDTYINVWTNWQHPVVDNFIKYMYDKQHPWLMIIMKYLCSYFWSLFWQLKHSRLNKWQFMWVKLIIVSFWSVNYTTTKFIIIIFIVVIVAVITLTPSAPSSWYNFGYMTAYWQSSNFTDTRKSSVKIWYST